MGVTGCCGTGRFCLQTWVSWKPGYSGMAGKVPVLVLLSRLRLVVPREQAELREGWARPGAGALAATWGGLQSCLWPVLRHVAEAGPSMSAPSRRVWSDVCSRVILFSCYFLFLVFSSFLVFLGFFALVCSCTGEPLDAGRCRVPADTLTALGNTALAKPDS